MKRRDESMAEWQERDYAQLRAWGRRLSIIAGVLVGIVMAAWLLIWFMVASTASNPDGARESVSVGQCIFLGAATVAAGGLWFAGQVLHVRAAAERIANRQ